MERGSLCRWIYRVEYCRDTSDAVYRPMGLASGPDGSLYISESIRKDLAGDVQRRQR